MERQRINYEMLEKEVQSLEPHEERIILIGKRSIVIKLVNEDDRKRILPNKPICID